MAVKFPYISKASYSSVATHVSMSQCLKHRSHEVWFQKKLILLLLAGRLSTMFVEEEADSIGVC